MTDSDKRAKGPRSLSLALFEAAVVCPTVLILVVGIVRDPHGFSPSLLLWGLVVASVELLPVPAWRGLQVSVSFPVLMAVCFLYSPVPAATVAFVASTDPREFRRDISVLRAGFNRSQIALAVLAASTVFHSLASLNSAVPLVVGAAVLSVSADYVVNTALVAVGASLMYRVSIRSVVRELKIGDPVEYLVSYLGLGVLGVVLAQLFDQVGFWSVAVFVVPLILARQMFFRSRALEEAHKELEDREVILRRLSNRMAEERQDERAQIAAYLHDDLAQLLFRMSLQVDLASRYLDQDNLDEVRRTLSDVKETKNRTSEKIRSLIRDLHRSPLGRAGLPDAIASFTTDVGTGSDVSFDLDVDDLPLPPPIQLLTYQIAREAIMNALKYAEASRISVSFKQRDTVIELAIHDDGRGFDARAGEPEGHYGLTMMRERAHVVGGSFDLVSAQGHGTGITVRYPRSWLQNGDSSSAKGGASDDADAGEEPDAAPDSDVLIDFPAVGETEPASTA